MWKLLALLALCLVAVNAGRYVIPYTPKPKGRFDYVTGCYIPSLNTVIPINEPYYAGCVSYFCSRKADYSTFVSSCPTYNFDDPSCALVQGDDTLVYPACCAYVVCSNPDASYTTVA